MLRLLPATERGKDKRIDTSSSSTPPSAHLLGAYSHRSLSAALENAFRLGKSSTVEPVPTVQSRQRPSGIRWLQTCWGKSELHGGGYPFGEIFQGKSGLRSAQPAARPSRTTSPEERDTVQSSCINRRTRGRLNKKSVAGRIALRLVRCQADSYRNLQLSIHLIDAAASGG